MMGLGSLNLAGGSALPFDGFELAMDFKNGLYRSQKVVTKDVTKMPGYAFARGRIRYERQNGVYVPYAANDPAIIPGVGFMSRAGYINRAPNSSWAGATAAGAQPNLLSMSIGTTTGITRAITGVGVDSGLPYIDYSITGTATAAVTIYPIVTGTTSTTMPLCAAGEVWTSAFNMRLVQGTPAGIQSLQFQLSGRSEDGQTIYGTYGAPAFIANGNYQGQMAAGQSYFTYTTPALPAGSTRMYGYFVIIIPSGATVNATLRIYGMSIFRNTKFAPPIHTLTTGGEVNSGTDVMTLSQPAPVDEDWIIATTVSFDHASADLFNNVERVVGVSDGTGNNRMHLQRQSSGSINGDVIVGNVATGIPTAGSQPTAGRLIGAIQHRAGKFRVASLAGGTVAFSAEVVKAMPPVTTFAVGQALNGNAVDSPVEFMGYRRGTFSDDQVRTMLSALSQF
jgi:hypothetical protein